MEALIYLDTHILVWLYTGRARFLRPEVKQTIDNGVVLISPTVLLELEYLHEIGRLTVGGNEVVASLHTGIGLRICDLDFARVVQASLDLTWTRDPFDRLITGHAIAAQRPLVTRDETIREHCTLAMW